MLPAVTTLLVALLGQTVPEVTPADDLVITESCRIKPGTWRIPDEGEPGVLRIEGEHVTVLMDGVVIDGSAEGAAPDAFTGTGVIVRGESNIVHGGTVRGFRVGMFVDGGEGHWIIGSELTGNFAQRLSSTPEAEDASDWLRPHENDEGQWAENYGAGLRVKDAKDVRLLSLTGRGQQNGILLENVTDSLVRACDFSFHSGWGLAMWRSSDNRVERSSFDWCVRGYSHGVYERGQDSAGILVFEQCHRNRFTENSATHSGDGFFLYAGNETLKETGEGGCNDNLVEGNDFSFAVANGIEATFSTGNVFRDNRLEGCNYGIWAGYSRESVFEKNIIRDSVYAGIAIEHGSGNVIRGNLIEDSKHGIRLWWDEDEDLLASVYAEKNETASADTVVEGNLIRGGEAALWLRDSSGVRFVGNTVVDAEEEVVTEGDCPGLVVESAEVAVEPEVLEWREIPGVRRGREFIVVGEWGPYDFSGPLVAPARNDGGREARFRLLGLTAPAEIAGTTGSVRATIDWPISSDPRLVVVPEEEATGLLPFTVLLRTGERELIAEGTLLVTTWRVAFRDLTFDPAADTAAWDALLATEPALVVEKERLSFPFATGGPGEAVGPDGFATVATTTLALPAGDYLVTTRSDDGVRVRIDGEVVLENWGRHGPTVDSATIALAEGEHEIRIEHFELDGYAWLSFGLRPAE